MSLPFSEGFPAHTEAHPVINTIEEATRALDTLFLPFFNPTVLRKKLDERRNEYMAPGREHMSHWERAMRHGMDQMEEGEFQDTLRHHLETVTFPGQRERDALSSEAWKARRGETLTTVFCATQNATKQEQLRALAAPQGIQLIFLSPNDRTNEAALQQTLFMETASPLEYAQILAKHKNPHGESAYDPSTQAYLGLDTVVTAQAPDSTDAKPINKPTSLDEARSMIKAAAGKQITVITGIDFSMPRYDGETLTWPSAVLTSFGVRSVSDDAIDDYLRANPNFLQVSGGIDYASSAGQSLIDPEKNITVSYIESEKGKDPVASLSLNPKVAPALESLYLGTPAAPLKRILETFPSLYK